jgi:hypothetical protein
VGAETIDWLTEVPGGEATNWPVRTYNIMTMLRNRSLSMQKYQVTIQFEMNDEFSTLVPPHRTYINRLIEQGIIDHYVVTMETQRVWITFSADDKDSVVKYLSKSPLYKFWTYEIEEVFLVDGLHYRLPILQLN